MAQQIGFIGVGMMGHGMVKNLLEKGYAVNTMAHRNRKPLEDLLARGAKECTSAKAIAEASDMVIICVTGSPQVEANIYGDDGVMAGCRSGQIVIDCSTSEPTATARINADLAAKGVTLVDAPLARTPVEAEAGKLNTMVGATDEVLAKIRPVLEAFCENIFHVGTVGAGHKIKLINNFLAMGQAALIAEGLCACAATGVEIQKLYEVVSAGGPNSGIFQMLVPKAMQGDYTGLQFALVNAAKDIRYYNQMTESVPLTGMMGRATLHALVQGLNVGFQDGFVGSLIQAQGKVNGVKIIDD